MFQTIGHRGGFVQISTFGGKTTIKAYMNGSSELLGDHYTTVPGAKAAITRRNKEYHAERAAEHHRLCFG